MAFYVYIIELQNKSYYVGHTNDLHRRIHEHTKGVACLHTKKHPFKKLLWQKKYPDRFSASDREKTLKGWSRKKKEQLWRESSSS